MRSSIRHAVGTIALLGAVLALVTGIDTPALAKTTGNDEGAKGSFLSLCGYSHTAPDDPIVFPGQPGASHAHDFFGNTSTNAYSNLLTLETSSTLCNRPQDTASYWVPSLIDGGKVVRPTLATAYYEGRKPKSFRPYPIGLRMVTARGARVVWVCADNKQDSAAAKQTRPPDCPAPTHLTQRILFPSCWDGIHLDSPDHRSHMAFANRSTCPSSHPVSLPNLTLLIHYPAGVGGSDVKLSSGGPETAHADFFNAWQPLAQGRLVNRCVNTSKQCGAKGP
jgi:hypothetical protein